jgi:hypothetical protein
MNTGGSCRVIVVLLQSRGVELHERARVLDALGRHRDYRVRFADARLAAAGAEMRVAVADREHFQ